MAPNIDPKAMPGVILEHIVRSKHLATLGMAHKVKERSIISAIPDTVALRCG